MRALRTGRSAVTTCGSTRSRYRIASMRVCVPASNPAWKHTIARDRAAGGQRREVVERDEDVGARRDALPWSRRC